MRVREHHHGALKGSRARTALASLCLGAAAIVPFTGGVASAQQRAHHNSNPLHLITPGYLTVVAQSDQLPFDGIQNRAEVGFDISLDRALAHEMGLKITFHDQDFAGVLPALNAHEYDFGAMAILRTPQRAQEVSFTEPFYYGGLSVMVKKASAYTSVSQLASKRIGVLLGTAQGASAEQYLGHSIQLVTFENENEAVAALEGGQIDAVFIGYANTAPYEKEYPNLNVLKYWLLPIPNEIPVANGDSALVRALNRALNKLYLNGTYAKLYHKWMPGPISQLLIKAHKGFKG
jgi:polar amino acid transport system substrate-binding protein